MQANYLNGLLSDGRIGVCETMDNVRENLRIDCCLIQILNELLHLQRRRVNVKRNIGIKSPFCSENLLSLRWSCILLDGTWGC